MEKNVELKRSFSSLSDDSEEARARYLYRQWVGLGLTDVRLSNHTVLLSLPGSTPNTITDSSSRQCFLPNGIPCDQRGPSDLPKQRFSYAAYSAVGSLQKNGMLAPQNNDGGEEEAEDSLTPQGEVVDVQYGSIDDLRRAKDSLNLTDQIAVVKLGQAPLLYKAREDVTIDPKPTREPDSAEAPAPWTPPLEPLVIITAHSEVKMVKKNTAMQYVVLWLSLLSELGFGGALLYIDPCDAPAGHHTWHQAFRVTLNPGGIPAIAEVSREAGGSLTSLLVQPISAVLAKTLLSSPSIRQGDPCLPLAMPSNAERKKITLTVGNQLSSKKIYNVVGYLKGRRNPVSLLSDYIGPVTEVDRLDGKQKKVIKVPCPAVVREYNKNMGGVDLLDSLIALYRKKIRSKKWYHRLMFHYRYDHRNCLATLQERLQQHWDEKRGTDQMKLYTFKSYIAESLCKNRYVLVGSRHDSDQGGGASAIMNQLIAALTEQTKRGWVPDRTTVFCSWGGTALGNIGSYEWGKDNSVVLKSSAVAYVSLNSPVRGTETLRATASPTLLQLTSDIQRRQLLSCIRGGNCPGPNVSSLQLPGDVNFFANQLAVPTMEFAFEQTKAEEATSFLSEAQFSTELPKTLDPLFKFHETIAKPIPQIRKECDAKQVFVSHLKREV
ncbi:Inactive N-acetylated-alpha-linked acidic dipeptidase-like protein 2 [Collichthys lucidus]|uniref:Inactive N-acetylated-alpha-linked acidic dipeptidase-like protein 2 n=1 Tax=Collichthys lucidus TaxID=240159 RepID=A0A4V6ANT8_COLLU|nr:Inactive N-acetylated-alpha-linked acidic dipeptidase-like protein 2 [Collichthys lucidus]